jgi:hypothetical protein
MPSIVWGRHPQEAYDNPYEYEAQKQFMRECKKLFAELIAKMGRYTLKYHRDERTLEKATWLLTIDLFSSLSDCAHLLEEKRHRPVARVFRDAVETIDLLRVLHSGTPKAESTLFKWYENQTIAHSDSRKYIQEVEGEQAALHRRTFYNELSKFTHRTYRALTDSVSLGRGDLMVHDSHGSGYLVLPQTIAAYMAVLADISIQAAESAVTTSSLTMDEIQSIWNVALESHTVPRRFVMSVPFRDV